jgi:hypothetical protein
MTSVTAAQSTPRLLAIYLRRATWGLPAARRQELWNELEEHLLTRADHLHAFGTAYDQALAQAIAELGPPAKVSAAMTEVYLMPKILISAGATALALGAVFFALAASGAVVSVPGLTLQFDRLLDGTCAAVNAAGQRMDIGKRAASCALFPAGTLPANLAYVGLGDLKSVFNENGVAAYFKPSGDLELRYPNGTRRILTQQLVSGEQGYTQAANLIVSTIREPITPVLQLSGFDNPILALGKLRLQLGTKTNPVDGALFYQDVVPTLIGVLTSPHPEKGWHISFSSLSNDAGAVEHKIQTGLKSGEVVALVVRREQGFFEEDVAPVSQDGTATLRSDSAHLRFVTSPAQLTSKESSGRTNALLLRVTNIPLRNLKSGILRPLTPTSDAQ